MAATINCSGYAKQEECNVTGCAWNAASNSNAGACECNAGYGGNGNNADACTKCEGTKFKTAIGNAECSDCTETNTNGGSTGIPGSATSEGNTVCGCAVGFAGANATGSATSVTCTKCTDATFTGSPGIATCQKCGDKQTGVSASGTVADTATGPNVKCLCSNASEALFDSGCIACTGDGYTITDGACLCADGYTQDSTTGVCTKGGSTTTVVNCGEYKNETACNGDNSCAWSSAQTGSCQCKDSATNKDPKNCPVIAPSSASPLAILLICALIISVIASVATAAVVAKRKAAARRTAEVIVSDAL